jgi:hypothetical protein
VASGLGGEVECLAAGHARGSTRIGKDFDQAHPDPGVGRQAGMAGKDLERQDLQRVAGKNGRGLVEGPVAGGPSSPHVVVVHRRKVVVYQ